MRKRTMAVALAFLCLCACAAAQGRPDAALPDDPRYEFTYETAEYLDEAAYGEYLGDDGTLFARLLAFTGALSALPEAEYVPVAANPVEALCDRIPDECLINAGTEFAGESRYEIDGEPACAAEALQVSEGFFSLFPVAVAEGRGFTKVDYALDWSGPIPVILGAAYREAFALGDTFEAYYLFGRFSFTVVGFAGEGGAFYDRSGARMASVDRYILMPFLLPEDDSFFSRVLLLQRMGGFLAAEGGRDAAQRLYDDALREAGLGDWAGQAGVNATSIGAKLRGGRP